MACSFDVRQFHNVAEIRGYGFLVITIMHDAYTMGKRGIGMAFTVAQNFVDMEDLE